MATGVLDTAPLKTTPLALYLYIIKVIPTLAHVGAHEFTISFKVW